MTLPISGKISFSQIAKEIYGEPERATNLVEADVRKLVQISQGPITNSDLFGKKGFEFCEPGIYEIGFNLNIQASDVLNYDKKVIDWDDLYETAYSCFELPYPTHLNYVVTNITADLPFSFQYPEHLSSRYIHFSQFFYYNLHFDDFLKSQSDMNCPGFFTVQVSFKVAREIITNNFERIDGGIYTITSFRKIA